MVNLTEFISSSLLLFAENLLDVVGPIGVPGAVDFSTFLVVAALPTDEYSSVGK